MEKLLPMEIGFVSGVRIIVSPYLPPSSFKGPKTNQNYLKLRPKLKLKKSK